MRSIAFTLGALALTLPFACAHEDRAAPTTVTSGTPGGVRVTSADVRDDEQAPELRLADELCRREEVCGRLGRDERYPSIESCMSDQQIRSRQQLASWRCSPAASRARFEECLASVRSEPCATRLDRADRLATCRGNVACGP